MSDELTRVIEPLPGGLEALRARIAAETIEPLPGGLDALRERIAGESAQWDTVAQTVEPLVGGLAQLRRTIRTEARARRARFVPVALASVVAAAVVLVIVTRSTPALANRTAMKQLLGGSQPHPGAASLGLVDAPRLVTIAEDPRVPDQVVVFRWVQPRYAP